jgi:hypothetical protein
MTTTEELRERKRNRFAFLRRVYELSGGSQSKFLEALEIGNELQLSVNELHDILDYLEEEYLIKVSGVHGDDRAFRILHAGIVEIEAALDKPEQPTDHFPPFNVMFVGSMVNSQIQQGVDSGTQNLEVDSKGIASISDLVDSLLSNLTQIGASGEKLDDLKSQLDTIQAQLKSPRPTKIILKESLKSIRSIVEGLAANVLTSKYLPMIIAQIQQLGG